LQDGDGQAVEHDDQPDPGLHRGLRQAVGQPDDVVELRAAPGAEMALTETGDVGGVEPVGVAEGVDGHHRLDQRQVAGQVEGRASGRGDDDATDRRDLVRREQPPVDRQARMRAVRPAGDDEVDRCVLRTARRPEQFRGGVPADGTAALHEQVRGPGPEDERDVGVGGDVDVREEAAEPGPAQHAGRDQAGGASGGAAERVSERELRREIGVERHAALDGSRTVPVP
jgi:hypothetical protein